MIDLAMRTQSPSKPDRLRPEEVPETPSIRLVRQGGRLVRVARTTGLCLVTLWTAACHNPDAYTLGPSRIDEVVNVTLSASTIPADGIARLTITVQLDPATDADKRRVSLSTTAGTLIGAGREGGAIFVDADTSGRAVAELQSSTTPGSARLEVTVASITRSQMVEFSAVAPSDLFEVAVSRPSIPADGFSTSRITVTLKRLGSTQQRVVRFETSAGMLVTIGQVPARQAFVTADPAGIAVADLQSEKTVVTARVRVTALESPREMDVGFTRVNPTDIISFGPAPTALLATPADGVTPQTLTVRVASGLPAGRRLVTFRTTSGGFLPGRAGEFSIEADGSDLAHADLVTLDAGTHRVTATVDGTTAETEVRFRTSLPDLVVITPSTGSLRSGGTTTLTLSLVRFAGTVAARLPVDLAAFTERGARSGR